MSKYTQSLQFNLKFILLLACLTISTNGLKAQATTEPDSTARRMIPAITYSSDLGFLIGGMINKFNYGPASNPVKPYKEYTLGAAAISTKGLATLTLQNEKLNYRGSKWRVLSLIQGGRFMGANYFGIGNHSDFDENLWEDGDRFFYDSYSAFIRLQGRYPILERMADRVFDLAVSTNFNYFKGEFDDGSLMDLQRPLGYDGTFVSQLGLMLIYDTRDNEIIPTRGFRISGGIEIASPITFSDENYRIIELDAMYFKTIGGPLESVLALHYNLKSGYGDIPFFVKPTVGDDKNLRGYALNRFTGNASSSVNAELRNWIFQPTELNIRLGLNVFYDTGRVIDDADQNRSLFEDYHQTYGFGGIIGFRDSDVILRADYAISDEISRFYFTIGYAF